MMKKKRGHFSFCEELIEMIFKKYLNIFKVFFFFSNMLMHLLIIRLFAFIQNLKLIQEEPFDLCRI